MYCLEPAVPCMRVPRLAGVVFPGGLQLRERAIGAGLPWNVGQQLCQRAQTFFTPPQFFVLGFPLDEIGGQARQDIEQPQIAIGRLVNSFQCVEIIPTRSPRRDSSGVD